MLILIFAKYLHFLKLDVYYNHIMRGDRYADTFFR